MFGQVKLDGWNLTDHVLFFHRNVTRLYGLRVLHTNRVQDGEQTSRFALQVGFSCVREVSVNGESKIRKQSYGRNSVGFYFDVEREAKPVVDSAAWHRPRQKRVNRSAKKVLENTAYFKNGRSTICVMA